jgi:spermidine synthase
VVPFQKTAVTDQSEPLPDRTRRLLLLAVGTLGGSAVMTQLALMRELLGAFSGNELVFGISLGSWLLLTAAGTWLGRFVAQTDHQNEHRSTAKTAAGDATPSSRHGDAGVATPINLLVVGLICIAVLPLVQVVAVRVLHDVVFVRGAAAGVTGTVLGSMAALLPFCLVAGAFLTVACAVLARGADANAIGRVYFADSLGSIAGGILFSFVLLPWFDHFALLCFPAAVNLLLAAVLAWHFRRWLLLASTLTVAAGLGTHLALIDADAITTAVQHWGQPTVFRANSPYGRLVVTDDSGQLTFYENGVPVLSAPNVDQIEETVHYAMSQRPDARKVLLISGGVAGTAREILRYGVHEVAYVELDPMIIAAGRQLLPQNLAGQQIRIITADGRRFVQQTGERYDVVIIDLPDPSTSQLNRYYTAEFQAEVRRVLVPGGVLSFALGHYENYVSPELAQLLSSAHHTLRQSFANVCMIPGGRIYFLASDGPLTLDIAARLERRGVATRLVNRHYLAAMLAPDRRADLDRAVAQPAKINTDFAPALYYYHLRHWLSQFTERTSLLGGILLVLLTAYLYRLRAVPRVVFAAGFAAMAIEIVLLLGFQALYGSLYQQVGLVVTVFMAGLAAGAWHANRTRLRSEVAEPIHSRRPEDGAPEMSDPARSPSVRLIALLSVAIAGMAALLPFILPHLGRFSAPAGQSVILLFTFLLALLVGWQFPLAGAVEPGGAAAAASRLYTADLVGASLGALLVSALLIPLVGVTTVCLLTAGLNLAAAALAWRPAPPA